MIIQFDGARGQGFNSWTGISFSTTSLSLSLFLKQYPTEELQYKKNNVHLHLVMVVVVGRRERSHNSAIYLSIWLPIAILFWRPFKNSTFSLVFSLHISDLTPPPLIAQCSATVTETDHVSPLQKTGEIDSHVKAVVVTKKVKYCRRFRLVLYRVLNSK